MKFLRKKHSGFNIMDIMKRNCSKYYINLLVATIFISVASQTYGQTDDCSYAGTPITVGGSCSYSTFNSSNNTDYWDAASGCNSADRDDAWWYFTAIGTSTTITYTSSRDAVLHLFTGPCAANMTSLACSDATSSGAETISSYPTVIGQTYAIRIQRYNRDNSMNGSICVYSPLPPPSNDECAAATSLPCATSGLAGTTVATIAEPAPGGTASQYGVWYTFIGDGLSTTISSVASFDHEQVLLSGSCGSVTLINSADAQLTGGTETYTFVSTIGITYYVYIAQWSTSSTTTGTFTISRTCVTLTPPLNDFCPDAKNLPCATSNLAGTTLASIPEPPPSTTSDYGVWYEFTGDGQSTTISSLAAGGFDHEMTILSGSCGSVSVISDVDGAGAGGTESYTFTTVLSTQYYVFVAHATPGSTTQGTFTISRTCVPPPPPPPSNDECAAATSLPCATSGLAGTTVSTIAEPAPGGTASGFGVWYTFTGDGLSTTISSVASFDHEQVLLSGSCGSLTLINNADAMLTGGTETYSFFSTIGTTYYVYIAHYSTSSTTTGTFTISRDCITPSDYKHSIGGINNEYVGDCLVSDCGPFTYADDGDTGSDYAVNINQIYRVFCPEVASNCMEITFNSFETEANYDYLQIKNGPTQNSTQIVSLTGDLSSTVPLTYTSTDESGCLAFRFNSDASVAASGWDATLQCVPCAGGPNGVDNNDCANLMPLCSGTSVAGNSTGPGIKAEGCTGNACPAGGENHTNWYSFTAFSTGTLTVTMTPNVATDDYDFAIYGPNTTCSSLGSPIRCTDSGVTGTTGLTGTATDNTEDVMGDSFLQTMNVTAGESYILVIDEWSPDAGGGYMLEFGGTASLDCTLLPVELTEFGAEYAPDLDIVDVFWTTASEENNDRFELERSANGEDYERIHTIDAVGNSNMESKYYTIDTDPLAGMNYYRLKQVDIEGSYEYSKVVAVNLLDDAYDIISIAPNPTNSLTEIVFNCYSKEEAVLVIYDSQGSLINRKSLSCVPGGNRVTIDLSNNRNGLYMISLSTSNKTYSSKILKN